MSNRSNLVKDRSQSFHSWICIAQAHRKGSNAYNTHVAPPDKWAWCFQLGNGCPNGPSLEGNFPKLPPQYVVPSSPSPSKFTPEPKQRCSPYRKHASLWPIPRRLIPSHCPSLKSFRKSRFFLLGLACNTNAKKTQTRPSKMAQLANQSSGALIRLDYWNGCCNSGQLTPLSASLWPCAMISPDALSGLHFFAATPSRATTPAPAQPNLEPNANEQRCGRILLHICVFCSKVCQLQNCMPNSFLLFLVVVSLCW